VAVVPGDSFGANGSGFLRLSYATDQARLLEAVERIKEFLVTFPALGRAGNFL